MNTFNIDFPFISQATQSNTQMLWKGNVLVRVHFADAFLAWLNSEYLKLTFQEDSTNGPIVFIRIH